MLQLNFALGRLFTKHRKQVLSSIADLELEREFRFQVLQL